MVRKLPLWAIEMESPEKLKISDIKRLRLAEHLSWRCASDTKGSSTIHRKSVGTDRKIIQSKLLSQFELVEATREMEITPSHRIVLQAIA